MIIYPNAKDLIDNFDRYTRDERESIENYKPWNYDIDVLNTNIKATEKNIISKKQQLKNEQRKLTNERRRLANDKKKNKLADATYAHQ